jgi:PAS domain S-box-containing protein
MPLIPLIYLIALILSGVISILIAWYARHRKSGLGSPEMAVLMLLAGSWCLALGGETLASTVNAKIMWTVLSYPGNMLVPVMFWVFVLRYTQQDRWLTRRRALACLALPAFSVIMAATNPWHGLLWPSVTIQTVQNWPFGVYAHGPWFWVEVVYSYFFMAWGIAILLRTLLRFPGLYSSQTRLVLLGSLIPLAANALYAVNPGLVGGVDPTPIGFSLAGGLLALALFRYSLLDVTPVARDRLMEIIPDGMFVLDAQGRLADCNPAGQAIFGWDHPPLGRPASEIWADPPGLAGFARGEQPQTAEFSIPQKDAAFPYSFRLTILHNRQGQAAGRILLAHDLTERRRAEELVRRQARALEAADNGIVITNAAGRIEWVNPAFTRLTGYSFDEAIGQSTNILKSGQMPETFYHDMWRAISAGEVWRGELINRRKDGSLYHEEMTITPVLENHQTSRFIAIKQDVTARKQAEDALRAAHKASIEANQLKTQLLANVSHDLRTPLSAILGYADMLRSGVFGEVSEAQKDAASEIIDSVNQLVGFVNNLIGQAQIETGKLVLNQRWFEPSELLEAARATGGMLAKRKALRVEYIIAPNFPSQVYGDPYWLRQIVLNLVNNAVKFTDAGSVEVILAPVDGEHWSIVVKDTGIGIPAEVQAAIFEPFRQVDGSATRKYGGSGLGLTIVQELTTLMGGRIFLKSDLGKGSEFHIILPFQRHA